MEATSLPGKPLTTGELIVQNGRQNGARRPLGMPTTFLGRSAGCEVRLNVPEVDALHCLIVQAPTGVHLRDLNSTRGTFVNGQRVGAHVLQDGDVIEIGPFRLRLQLPPVVPEEEWAGGEERDAWRVQVAAVAAQQAALDEEEARLQQRRTDLQQQEEQLAAHLAERRRQLEQWSEQNLAERELWIREKAEHERRLQEQREQAARSHQQILEERERLRRIYQRLRQRSQGSEELERREEALGQEVLRFQAEREQASRQLREAQADLQASQLRWRRRRAQERAALVLRLQEVALAEHKLSQARALVQQEKEAWEAEQRRLGQELHGVNNRITNQRQKIQEHREELARLGERRRLALHEADSSVALPAPEGDGHQLVANLEQLAGELSDQRLHLIEQWERLARVQAAWHEQRERAVAELEALARQLLRQRERTIADDDAPGLPRAA